MKNLLILEALPAWVSNRLLRLIKAPKRYLVEPSIIASVLRLDQAALLWDGNLLGRMIDTFVAAQNRLELSVAQSRPRWNGSATNLVTGSWPASSFTPDPTPSS